LALATKLAFPNLDQHPHLFVFVVLIIALAATVVFVTIVLLVFRIYVEYQRRTFDVSTITPLVTLYESDAMESKFTLAAQKTLEIIARGWRNVDHPTDVDPVLDFLEDLGLQLRTNQVSDELVHHYFFVTIQSYYIALKEYVGENRKQYGKQMWQYIDPLFERTFLIEHKMDRTAKKHPPKERLIEFLEREAETAPKP